MSETGERPATDAWWRDALVYQVYVRSFADSDGDGIGDLPGIRSRLDQLAALGIDAIWLNPCFPSPQRDHGYDVSDYFGIHDEYGTLDDFDELLAAARERGIKILMDLVPNHCSSEHEWFRAALNAPSGSPERARFFFRDGLPNDDGDPHGAPPNNWAAAFSGSAWTRASDDDPQWYLGTFTPHQPDLDHRNSDVMKMFADMLEFWFDRGVEGFRVDAIVPVGKHPDLPDQPPVPEGTGMLQVAWENPYNNFRPEGHEIWKEFREIVDDYERRHPGRSLPLVAEAYMNGRPDLVRQYVNDAEFHGAFAFDLMLARWTKPAIEQALSDTFDLIETGQTATWTLNNHDAQRVVTRLGRDNADADANAGENMLDVDWNEVVVDLGLRRSRALVSLMMAMPGAVYLYAGEELGLPEVLDIPADRREDPVFHQTGGQRIGRDGCRIPLPWTDDPATNFGFSTLPEGVQQAPEPWGAPPPGGGGRPGHQGDGGEGGSPDQVPEHDAPP
ncbi:MAG: alpha-amylase family glycosyl hydrolase, partial [Actinomycetota bacterium]